MSVTEQELCQKYDLTTDQITSFKTIFQQTDTDDDKSLDGEELQNALTKLGYKSNPRSITAIIKNCDKNGDGQVEFDEFTAIIASKIKAEAQKPNKEKIFDVLDRDGDGFVTVQELQEAWIKVTGVKISNEEAEAIVAEADENDDGKISNEEFKNMWIELY